MIIYYNDNICVMRLTQNQKIHQNSSKNITVIIILISSLLVITIILSAV